MPVAKSKNRAKPGMQQPAQVPAKSGQQQVAKAPAEQEQASFPQFGSLPLEIQMKIFTEALDKPNLHIVTTSRESALDGRAWGLIFRPVAKSKDGSGYRRLQDLAQVNRTAYNAMRLATARHNVRLPFRGLNNRVDGAEDLVFLDIPQPQSENYTFQGFFHPDHQILNQPVAPFNEANLAAKFQGIQKVALKYDARHVRCDYAYSTFRCAANHAHHVHHIASHWRMCPDELCGLLNCFPNLREIYLVIVPDRGWQRKGWIRTYAERFYARKPTSLLYPKQAFAVTNPIKVPSASPLRGTLATFHSTAASYIEVTPAVKDTASAAARANRCYTYLPELSVYKGAVAMLTELLTRSFVIDADPQLDRVSRAQIAATYRLTLEERKKLVGKILIAVPKEMERT